MSRRLLIAASLTGLAWFAGISGHAADSHLSSLEPGIVDIALQIDDAARQSLQAARETDAPATLRLGTAAGGDTVFDVMIHVKGQRGSARTLDEKPAFKIRTRKGQRPLGLEHLTLNNMVQDPTMLHEALGYQVYAAAGVPVPEAGYARLTVNGQDYGLYLNVETIDLPFLKRRFGNSNGILYEGEYGVDLRTGDEAKFQLDAGPDPGRAQLTSFIRAVEAPGDGVFYGASAQVDTPSFLGMMAVQALIADWDNYYKANNYRIYWNPSVQRWFFIPTGIDQTFVDDSTSVFGGTGILFQKCLASERCTVDYAAAVRDVAGRFERLGLPEKMTSLLSVIDAASQADPKRPYDAALMTQARQAMRVFIAKRPDAVRAALSCADSGRERTLSDCIGAVAINPASNRCIEVVSRTPDRNGAGVRVTPCHGGVKQRWRLVARSNANVIEATSSGRCLELSNQSQDDGAPARQARCVGTANQLFSLQPGPQGTHIIARHSGKCLTIASRKENPSLIQAACSSDSSQIWRVQRSVFLTPAAAN
jgi:CotH kinase protein/Ricin-type beta-trefoil lectin domain